MKRIHLHVGVTDLETSIEFYSKLFGANPSVVKPDYAKWMLEDPRVNFAISDADHTAKGIEHIGIQAETADELTEIYSRLQIAGRRILEVGTTTCCYAQSEKSWVTDPDGVIWEAFLTNGDATVYGDKIDLAAANAAGSQCCLPAAAQRKCEPNNLEQATNASVAVQ